MSWGSSWLCHQLLCQAVMPGVPEDDCPHICCVSLPQPREPVTHPDLSLPFCCHLGRPADPQLAGLAQGKVLVPARPPFKIQHPRGTQLVTVRKSKS